MAFFNENTLIGLPPQADYQQGKSDFDDDREVERNVSIPWGNNPAGSYMYYDCTVGAVLDSGIVTHQRLPQINPTPDTLASADFNDPRLDQYVDRGVNLRSNDQYRDIVQRMGHSRYWFRIWGRAIRIAYKVPIPSIKEIGGVAAIPYDKNPQWAYNRIAPGANYSGVVVWYAQWSLWYTVDRPPTNNNIPAVDLTAHISGDAPIPDSWQAPWSEADDSAQRVVPGSATGGIISGQV